MSESLGEEIILPTEPAKVNREQDLDVEQLSMEKVVDIYSERNLKYRTMSPFALINTLENGVALGSHRKVYGEVTIAEKTMTTREIRKDIERHREDSETENRNLATANIFYPEGILNIIHSLLHGEIEKQTYLKRQNSSTIRGSIITFRNVCKTYEGTSLEPCEMGLADKIVNYLLNKIATPAELDEHISFQTPEVKNEEIEAIVSRFDSSFERIRRQWLKVFFEESQRPLRAKPNSSYGTLIGGYYVPLLGVVFDGETKVYINQPNPDGDDFPTEASLRQLNNKRHISGIFLNTGFTDLNRFTHDTEYADFIDDPREFIGSPGHAPMPLEEYLRKAHFQIKNPIWFVYDFINMIPEKTRELIERRFDTVTREKMDKLVKGDGYHGPDTYSYVLWKESTEQERVALQKCAHELLAEFSNIQEGQTFWEIIMNEAKKHNLPVYGIDGRLIWPREMTHEELENFLVEKKN